jgi:type I restriction enzyme S subunit
LLRIECAIPSADSVKKFVEVVKPMFDQVARAREQSRTLAAIRNALLPKLLSGEIRV